jgi:hypothetical protein
MLQSSLDEIILTRQKSTATGVDVFVALHMLQSSLEKITALTLHMM